MLKGESAIKVGCARTWWGSVPCPDWKVAYIFGKGRPNALEPIARERQGHYSRFPRVNAFVPPADASLSLPDCRNHIPRSTTTAFPAAQSRNCKTSSCHSSYPRRNDGSFDATGFKSSQTPTRQRRHRTIHLNSSQVNQVKCFHTIIRPICANTIALQTHCYGRPNCSE
jgi:hypothetical protein